MGRGAWQDAGHRITRSRTLLNWLITQYQGLKQETFIFHIWKLEVRVQVRSGSSRLVRGQPLTLAHTVGRDCWPLVFL